MAVKREDTSNIMCESDSGLNEYCGVFGCLAKTWPTELHVANVICLGLVGLQHRGQESCGMVTSKGEDPYQLARHKGMGLVSQVFNDTVINKLENCNLGIGHARYSTAGDSEMMNCQPFVVETVHGLISVAHNGELVNANPLKQRILRHGVGLSTGSDSELITQVIAMPPPDGESNGPDWVARLKHLMQSTLTSYSLLMMHKDTIYAVRDPFGNRPLCIGKLMTTDALGKSVGVRGRLQSSESDYDGWVVSSESCSFHSIGAKYYREVQPGEIIRISKEGVKSMGIVPRPGDKASAFCIFEYVYFARPDSIFEGQSVYTVRRRCGEQLALESHVAADLVSTVPESATPSALGYSKASGLPYIEVLCKNRYVGRTFIQPSDRLRKLGVAKKFGPLTENFKGKRVILIDDSVVRGTTMGPIIRLLKNAGAKEVHVRVASPPLKFPCYMGINIPTRGELIANKLTPEELSDHLGADSLKYLSLEGLLSAVQGGIEKKEEKNIGHCTACLTGDYPVELHW